MITAAGVYPHSMVAAGHEPISNMYPTTACIAGLAVFQAAIAMLLRARVSALLARPRVWHVTVAANGLAMTVFIWHMTALLIVIAAYNAVGGHLGTQPTIG